MESGINKFYEKCLTNSRINAKIKKIITNGVERCAINPAFNS